MLLSSDVFIIYFPTKDNPKDKFSNKDLIIVGLEWLKKNRRKSWNIINMPALGCGLGGLDFEGWLKPLVYEMFENEPYTINLFEPK